MNHTSYLMSQMADEAVWEHLQVLLQEYDPEVAEKHATYIAALDALSEAGADAKAFKKAVVAATASDALFAFHKGMEANLYHFQHPYVPNFASLDFEDMFQEHVMRCMPKRSVAEKVIEEIQSEYFQEDVPWCETISEYIIDLDVVIPKIMHFEGYKAGNAWFAMTVPGYQEDYALTSVYIMQLQQYFGKYCT